MLVLNIQFLVCLCLIYCDHIFIIVITCQVNTFTIVNTSQMANQNYFQFATKHEALINLLSDSSVECVSAYNSFIKHYLHCFFFINIYCCI